MFELRTCRRWPEGSSVGEHDLYCSLSVRLGRSAPVGRFTIAQTGKIAPEQAREQAKKILAEVTAGADPAARRAAEREEITVATLADAFLADHVRTKRRATTARTTRAL